MKINMTKNEASHILHLLANESVRRYLKIISTQREILENLIQK